MEAIESVRQQTYTNWEIVLVDDGSKDNSQNLYNDLQKDDRIHIFYDKENKGCGYTKHRCVLHANGEYCGFLDPDDALLPKALEVSVNALRFNPNTVLTMSRFYICDEELNIREESRLLELKKEESYYEHGDFSPEHFASFSKDAYCKTSGIDECLLAAVDQDLYFKLEEVGQISYINEFTYKYRIHQGSVSQGENANWAWYWNIIVWHNTCQRRKLSEHDFAYKDFNNFVNRVKTESRYEIEKTIRKSMPYKIGSAIVKPIKFFFKR